MSSNLTAAERVYRTPELMSQIIQNLERRHAWKVFVLEKGLFPLSVQVLWREVPYRVAQEVIDLWSPRGGQYIEAIQSLVIQDPALPKDEASQMALITSLPEDFMFLREATCKSSKQPWRDDWKLRVTPEGICQVDLWCEFKIESGTLPEALEEEVMYPGFEVNRHCTINLDVDLGRFAFAMANPANAESERTLNIWLRYLVDSERRNPQIHGLDFGSTFLSLHDLGRLVSYQHEDHLSITEVRVNNVQGFNIEAFERFCLEAGERLDVLELDASMGLGIRLPLSCVDRVTEIIAEHLQNIRSLSLPISIAERGKFVPVTQVKVSSSILGSSLRKLRRVTLVMHGGLSTAVDRYPLPIEDIAQNLALLGAGKECVYELKNKTSVFLGMNVSKALNVAVHEFQRLAPDGLITQHARDVPPAYGQD
ncbi:hypothetical protein I317_05793 [Kwoniella heveanensis CBS 569]|nr:hypothetical protein I317_05793 [Kwoniella heveanensis CBS 569]